MDIEIDSKNSFDQLVIRFAQYHLLALAPKHDTRFGIAAKGLSGEGYKGHSFWDTEIFILPFFTYTFPEIARNLLDYRYNTIEGARNRGYKVVAISDAIISDPDTAKIQMLEEYVVRGVDILNTKEFIENITGDQL